MIQGICFKDERFDKKNNTLFELTNNTIILCDRVDIKSTLFRDVLKICQGERELSTEIDYWTNHDKKPEISKMEVSYLPTSVFYVDELQRICITNEMPCILQAKEIKDLWFAVNGKDGFINVYPLTSFEKSDEIWDRGIWEVYRWVANGRYGGDFHYCSQLN